MKSDTIVIKQIDIMKKHFNELIKVFVGEVQQTLSIRREYKIQIMMIQMFFVHSNELKSDIGKRVVVGFRA